MHRFDIISGAPKTFIFQKNSNKTNLGGIFTILFIVMAFLIIFSYLYEYFVNDKYNVSYTYDEKYYEYEDEDKIYNDDKLYPKIDYHLYVNGNIEKSIKTCTIDKDGELIEIPLGENHTTTQRVSEIVIVILYKCLGEVNGTHNCTLREEDKDEVTKYINIFNLAIDFNGYYCDHQNPDSPIKRNEDYTLFPFTIEDRIDYYKFGWKIIQYSEEHSFSGMLRSTDEYYGGSFTKPERFSIPWSKSKIIDYHGVPYQLVSALEFNKNGFGFYDFYKRDKISIFDPIANICALITTVYGVLTFIFCGIYSDNFDNYKIVEKILSNKSKSYTKREEITTEIELTNKIIDNKEDTLLDVNEKDNNDEKIEINNIKEDKSATDIKPSFKLPKFHFYSFIYNNIYSEKCCSSSTQEIISSCNDIITKYYSIDAVIYNQLKLENLFRDYKWNNPKLNTIENNDLISKIKSLSGN